VFAIKSGQAFGSLRCLYRAIAPTRDDVPTTEGSLITCSASHEHNFTRFQLF